MKHLFNSEKFNGLIKRMLPAAFCAVSFTGAAQAPVDLAQLKDKHKLVTVNRTILALAGTRGAVQLDERKGEGIAWLPDVTFAGGSIDIDLKGKDELQKSFLGIAFHGLNDSTYDAIYFRPFNFRTKDSVRSIHAVQYISHPDYPWKKLRDEKNAQYEKAIVPAPDPNAWFHAKIQVSDEAVLVFVNHAAEPALKIKKLNARKTGKIGLWVGEGSGGTFNNLLVKAQ